MNCSESEQFFDAYLDRELSGSLRLEFDAHRLRCRVCQQKLAMMEACEHILARDDRMPALSESFTDEVMSKVSERRITAQRSRKRRLVIGATVAFQAAAVLVFAMIWWGSWNSDVEPVVSGESAALIREAGIAIDSKDSFQLSELIYTALDRRALAAGLIERDLRDAWGYAANMSVLGELTSPAGAGGLSPLDAALQMFAPAPAEEVEPAPSESGSFSL